MLKMSFYDGTLKVDELDKVIRETAKPIVYTYGFEYRHPTTHRVPISKEKALEICHSGDYLDATEEENCLHLNAFSSNDMW